MIGLGAAVAVGAGVAAITASATPGTPYSEPSYTLPIVAGVVAVAILASGIPLVHSGFNERTAHLPECEPPPSVAK